MTTIMEKFYTHMEKVEAGRELTAKEIGSILRGFEDEHNGTIVMKKLVGKSYDYDEATGKYKKKTKSE